MESLKLPAGYLLPEGTTLADVRGGLSVSCLRARV